MTVRCFDFCQPCCHRGRPRSSQHKIRKKLGSGRIDTPEHICLSQLVGVHTEYNHLNTHLQRRRSPELAHCRCHRWALPCPHRLGVGIIPTVLEVTQACEGLSTNLMIGAEDRCRSGANGRPWRSRRCAMHAGSFTLKVLWSSLSDPRLDHTDITCHPDSLSDFLTADGDGIPSTRER